MIASRQFCDLKHSSARRNSGVGVTELATGKQVQGWLDGFIVGDGIVEPDELAVPPPIPDPLLVADLVEAVAHLADQPVPERGVITSVDPLSHQLEHRVDEVEDLEIAVSDAFASDEARVA